ncbi:MAG: hypothetical protein ACXADO_12995, partial [Candidatus Thorarchaeota archaeon]|jgi:hypothetical protein
VEKDTLIEMGFRENRRVNRSKKTLVFEHQESILFPLVLSSENTAEVALRPESLVLFVQMNERHYDWPDLRDTDESYSVYDLGEEYWSSYKKALISTQDESDLWAVERFGYDGYKPESLWRLLDGDRVVIVLAELLTRQRHFENESVGLEATLELIKDCCQILSDAQVAELFFRSERRYWQNRDRGGQVQKARQDRLGLGWGNHDHHTFRSSRENFHLLIEIFETMGFERREQFFAGEKAGWGAQVLEQPVCGISIFADVDISTEERDRDFANEPMEARSNLGTVGLWVALHGESILSAGMHHLAARVDFEHAIGALQEHGVRSLSPFSDFDFLKQAFVESETRPVEARRLDSLTDTGLISQDRHSSFRKSGAISSHLEVIQRGQGFKGFNQDSVSVIISATDPRKHLGRSA